VKFELSLRFNKTSVKKQTFDATDYTDLERQIKLNDFWNKNKDRAKIERKM